MLTPYSKKIEGFVDGQFAAQAAQKKRQSSP